MAKDFYATRSTAWWKVAVAMIGSCLSGVTFVSVPGMVGSVGFGYLQMCVGFFLGYLVIAFVLTPLYFRLNVVSVYQYLEQRFGVSAHKTGAWFFFLSKMLGAAVRLFLMIATLQLLVAGPAGIPFWVTVLVVVVPVALCLVLIAREVGAPDTSLMRVFYFDDVNHPQFFWKQLLGGLFTAVYVGWIIDRKVVHDQLTNGGRLKGAMEPYLIFCLRYVAPVSIIFIFLYLTRII